MNRLKTMMLLATLTALLLFVGQALGGRGGLMIALVFAGVMNFVSYWWSDKIVLSMYGAQAVEVAVDRETGVIKLVRVASAHDVGKAINPLAVTGQIEGGILMGLGYALSEGLLFDEGKIINASFADYKIPTIRDIPAATPMIVEKDYNSEPYGAKGVGEMSVFGIAPAVANAVAHLTGVRIKDLPLSAEKLRGQLKESKEK